MKLIGYNHNGQPANTTHHLVFEDSLQLIHVVSVSNIFGLRDLVLNSGLPIIDQNKQYHLKECRLRAHSARSHGLTDYVLLDERDLLAEWRPRLRDACFVVQGDYLESNARFRWARAVRTELLTNDYRLLFIEPAGNTPVACKRQDTLPIYVDNNTPDSLTQLGKLIGGRLCPWGQPYIDARSGMRQLREAGYDPTDAHSIIDFYYRGIPPYSRASAGTGATAFTIVPLPQDAQQPEPTTPPDA